MSLHDLVHTYRMKVDGVVHVGAHTGEEIDSYRNLLGNVPVTWIEADPDVFPKLVENMEGEAFVTCINATVSDKLDRRVFHRANNEYSSSLLELGTHKTAHPDVHYIGAIEVETVTLDSLANEHGLWKSNFLVMDVQGAEGMVIAGADKFLAGVDYIYSEVSRDELYVGCARLEAFDLMLKERGFRRVELALHGELGWGDAFYVRDKGLVSLARRMLRRVRNG